jgi:hypothetical protein
MVPRLHMDRQSDMQKISRRRLLQYGATLSAAATLPWSVPARAKAPTDTYNARDSLPILELDIEASLAGTRLITKGAQYATMPKGAIIMVPAGVTIPAFWWSMKVTRGHEVEPGARFILRGEDKNRRSTFAVPQNQGMLNLVNYSDTPISMELENLVLKAGKGGDALRLSGPDHVRLTNVQIVGGKNGIFAPTHPLDLEMYGCEVMHSGNGSGLTHNVYLNYTRGAIIHDCRFHSPRAQGHVFKGYAQHMDIRNCYFSHYETPEDLTEKFFGELPVLDRGAWGSTIAVGNTFVRRGPARDVVVDVRNRAFPPGYSEFVRPGWGTEPVDFHLVDNRDATNPHLFNHFFYNNTVINGILPDKSFDPKIAKLPGSFVRNNGSTPWDAHYPGNPEKQPTPADFRPQNERAVVYLAGNTVKGIPFKELYQNYPFGQNTVITPVRELKKLPQWLKDWAKV